MAEQTYRFVTTRVGADDKPLEVVGATPSGDLRTITLTPSEALRVIKDLAEGLHMLRGDIREETQ